MISDRELTVALFKCISALAEKLTGESLVVSLRDEDGNVVKMESYGADVRWVKSSEAALPEPPSE